MGWVSLICQLLKRPRRYRRWRADRTARELTHHKFMEFFDTASTHYKLRPVRVKISKDRRH
jgi:hypothetical protein